MVPAKDGGSARLVPNTDGGLIHLKDVGHPLACHCRAGEKWAGVFPLATPAQMEKAKARQLKLQTIGKESLKAGILGTMEGIMAKLKEVTRMNPARPYTSETAKQLNALMGMDSWLEARQVLLNLKPQEVVRVEEAYVQALEGKISATAFHKVLKDAEAMAQAVAKGRGDDQ